MSSKDVVNSNDIEDWFRQYFRVFSTLDLEAIIPHYHSPMIVVLPGGAIALKDMEEIRNTFGLIFSQYQAAGYGRSEIAELGSRYLGDDLAEVGGRALRFDSSGGEMNSFVFRYVMRKESDSWTIVVMVNGDPVLPSA